MELENASKRCKQKTGRHDRIILEIIKYVEEIKILVLLKSAKDVMRDKVTPGEIMIPIHKTGNSRECGCMTLLGK